MFTGLEIPRDYYNLPASLAYILVHFLDRYYRFCLIFKYLIELDLLPDNKEIRLMDIGTGPGPSMYAYSDIIQYLSEYEKANGILKERELKLDYAEQSEAFRSFLHWYTEILLMEGKNSSVPFHNGTYRNAKELNFKGKITVQSGYTSLFSQQNHYVYRSYNMIIYSNFLTNERTALEFKEQIKQGAFWLKNNGIIIIVGANPNLEKYAPVYRIIEEALKEQRFITRDYWGNCKLVVDKHRMSYQNSELINKKIYGFHMQMIEYLTNGDWEKISPEFKKIIENENKDDGETSWYLTVYKKESRRRYRKQ